jgi:hypothetical protein
MEMVLIQAESDMNVHSMLCDIVLDPSPLFSNRGPYLLLPVLTCSHCTIQTQKHFIRRRSIYMDRILSLD